MARKDSEHQKKSMSLLFRGKAIGALENDSELLFKNSTVYIGEIENRYLTGEIRRKVFRGFYKLPMVKMPNEKKLLKDGEVFYIDGDKHIAFVLKGTLILETVFNVIEGRVTIATYQAFMAYTCHGDHRQHDVQCLT